MFGAAFLHVFQGGKNSLTFFKIFLAPQPIGASLGSAPTNGVCGPLEQEAGTFGDGHFYARSAGPFLLAGVGLKETGSWFLTIQRD
jgi:hypothetical protein